LLTNDSSDNALCYKQVDCESAFSSWKATTQLEPTSQVARTSKSVRRELGRRFLKLWQGLSFRLPLEPVVQESQRQLPRNHQPTRPLKAR
jgi:hypothetical protein